MRKPLFQRWRTDFVAGLAVLLPALISIAVVIWLFGSVANITDKLLVGVPHGWKYINGISGDIYWYWRLAALLLAFLLVALAGRLTRYYVGKKLLEAGESLLLRVPLLNKIYATIKQVKEAFAGKQSSFKEAVLVRFPCNGLYSLGFITGEQHKELQEKTLERVLSVFVPTTPNPTTGFLLLVPDSEIIRLDMSVGDAIRTIISLGMVTPDYSGIAVMEQSRSVGGPHSQPMTRDGTAIRGRNMHETKHV